MFIDVILPAILMIPIGIYIHYFIRRILNTLLKDKTTKEKKKINIILTLIIMIPALYVWGVWAIVIMHVFVVALCMDALHYFVSKISKKENMTFKKIHDIGVIPLVIVILVLGYGYINMNNVIQTDYTISSEKNIRSEGYKIAFISDLHFGINMDDEKLQRYCSHIESNNPDIVILGGDIVDENTTLKQMHEAFSELSKIKSVYGTFYVYGNHDKSNYSINPNFTEEELNESLKDNGITILEDETFKITDDVTITGRKDRSFSGEAIRKSSEQLAEEGNITQDTYNIIVDHQPNELTENSNAGYDIMLSGHTHAGQIWPAGLFINLFGKDTLNYGHAKHNDMDVIVSSGIGGWGYPLRTEEHCEYVIINISAN